ncbi:MAG: toxin-antitoxin system YwqK family antitoxin [Planctomycetaceae bacterium]
MPTRFQSVALLTLGLASASLAFGQSGPSVRPVQRRFARALTQQPFQTQAVPANPVQQVPPAPVQQNPSVEPLPDGQVFPPPVIKGGNTVVEPDKDTPDFPDREADIDPNAPVETVEEKYEDGRVRIRREVTLDMSGNYVNHGSWTMFDRESNEIASGRFNNNRRDGDWMRKYEFGRVKVLNNPPYSVFEGPYISKATFKDGKLDGKWTIADNEGRVCSEWNYKDGLLDGEALWNFTSGAPYKKMTYKQGMLDGAYKEWSQKDEVIADDTYQAGRKLASKQKLYENGAVMWEGMFLHERVEMETSDDWWNCEPAVYKTAGEPIRHGKLTSWYRTGQKQSEGIFQDNVRAGEFTWWHKNTQKAVQGTFKDDKPHGTWNWWHENGQKSIQGQYDMGQATGDWLYWKSNGRLEKRTNRDNVDLDDDSVAANSLQLPKLDVSDFDQSVRPAAGERVSRRVPARGTPTRRSRNYPSRSIETKHVQCDHIS